MQNSACECTASISMQKMVLDWSSGKKMSALQHFWFVTYSLLCFFQFLYSASLPQNSTSFGKHLPSAWCLGCAQGQHTASYCYKQCRGGRPSSVTISVLRWLSTSFWQLCLYKTVLLTWIHYPLLFPGDNATAILYKSVCSGIELWATGRSNLSKLAGLLLTTTSNA